MSAEWRDATRRRRVLVAFTRARIFSSIPSHTPTHRAKRSRQHCDNISNAAEPLGLLSHYITNERAYMYIPQNRHLQISAYSAEGAST